MTTPTDLDDPALFEREGRDYTRREAAHIARRSVEAFDRMRRRGKGPPVRRLSKKHSRVSFPRAQFWQWLNSFVIDEAAER